MATYYSFKETDGTETIVEQDSILRAVEDLAFAQEYPVLKVIVDETAPATWNVTFSGFRDEEEYTLTYVVGVVE